MHFRFAPCFLAAAVALISSSATGAILSGPNMDPNVEGLAFNSSDAFSFGGWGFDDTAVLNGNDVAAITNNGTQGGGAGLSTPISNGVPAASPFAPNTSINPGIEAVNGVGNGLAAGNVVRLSIWFRSDANDPVTADPQIPPVLKFEFHSIALGTGATSPTQNVLYDTDTNGGAGEFVNSNEISTTAWTLFSHEYEINGGDFDVSLIEELRPVLFTGDFTNSNTPTGTYLFDNVLVEVFADATAAAATPVGSVNPMPVPEPTSLCLLSLVALSASFKRTRTS